MLYKTVYLLDDNDTTNFYNLDVVEDALTGCLTECFTSTTLFIERFMQTRPLPPDKVLLLLDINMPDKQGFEVIEELEELNEDLDCLDIIILSSSNLKIDREKATKYPNVFGFIEKPLTVEKLENTINGVF